MAGQETWDKDPVIIEDEYDDMRPRDNMSVKPYVGEPQPDIDLELPQDYHRRSHNGLPGPH